MFKVLLNYYIKPFSIVDNTSIFRSDYDTNIPEPLDVTNRIAINDLNSFKENMENGRFAWESSDVKFQLNNYDSLLEAGSFRINTIEFIEAYNYFTSPIGSFDVDSVYGLLIYLYWKDDLLFQGVITDLGGFKFDNTYPKTVEFTCYSFHELIRNQIIEIDEDTNVSDGSYNASLSISEVENELETLIENNCGYINWNFPRLLQLDFDLTGIADFDYSILLSELDFYDIWQSPLDKRVFGIVKEADEVAIYELRANSTEKMFTIDIRGGGTRFVRFIRANLAEDTIAVIRRSTNFENWEFYVYSYTGENLVADRTTLNIRGFDDIDYEGYVYQYYITIRETIGRIDVDDYLYRIETDGISLFRIYDDGDIKVDKYDIYENFIDTTTIEAINWTHVFVTGENIITYRRNIGADIYYYSGYYDDTYSRGIKSQLSNYYSGDFKRYRIYPTFENDIDYTAFGEIYTNDLETGSVRSKFRTNDPLLIALSSMFYDKPTFEDIFSDLAQFFNAVLFIRNGIIYLQQVDSYIDEHIISEDWISKATYTEKIDDKRFTIPKIDLRCKGASDSEDKFDTNTVIGNLRIFYRDRLQQKFREIEFEIPTIKCLDYKLGDRITINETGKNGILINRDMGFGVDGKMSKIKIRGVV